MSKNSAATIKKSAKTGGLTRKSAGKNWHVVHHPEGWIIRSEGSFRVSSCHSTQREAVETARLLAERDATTLVIHSRDGRVKSRNSYRREPLPPPMPRKVLHPLTMPRTASIEAIKRAVTEAINEAALASVNKTESRKESQTQRQGKAGSKRNSRREQLKA
jgi:hypothetical protein